MSIGWRFPRASSSPIRPNSFRPWPAAADAVDAADAAAGEVAEGAGAATKMSNG